MLTALLDIEDTVRTVRNITVNSDYQEGLLERLRNHVRRNGPQEWESGFVLHHDNTPCHTPLLVHECKCVLFGIFSTSHVEEPCFSSGEKSISL